MLASGHQRADSVADANFDFCADEHTNYGRHADVGSDGQELDFLAVDQLDVQCVSQLRQQECLFDIKQHGTLLVIRTCCICFHFQCSNP
jgi:hypothetical protein